MKESSPSPHTRLYPVGVVTETAHLAEECYMYFSAYCVLWACVVNKAVRARPWWIIKYIITEKIKKCIEIQEKCQALEKEQDVLKSLEKFFLSKSTWIEFGSVWFYGISTIVGYLMPNQVYSYILDIYDL